MTALKRSKKFGLIGHPLSHSFSKKYFEDRFPPSEFPYTYELIDIAPDEVDAIVESEEYDGLNITIPYKTSVLDLVTSKSMAVNKILATNCLIKTNKGYRADNTDVIGFKKSIEPFDLTGMSALVLGTGGASRAITYVLDEKRIPFVSVSRSSNKGMNYVSLDENILASHLLIINTTPLGMYPDVDDAPDFPFPFLNEKHIVIDLIYNPEETRFLAEAKKQNCTILNGMKMLTEQAEAAYKLWGIV